jgi:hypothetical protein
MSGPIARTIEVMRTRAIGLTSALVFGAALLACSPAPSPSPAATESGAPASGESAGPPSPSSGSPGAAAPCVATDLAIELSPWEGAAGSRFVVLTARTQEDIVCSVAGRPGVALQDAAAEILIDSMAEPDGQPRVEPGDPVVVIGPDSGATLAIGTSNWCEPPPTAPLGILLTFPDDSTVGHIPADGSLADVPPCVGPGEPPTIFIQAPWQPEL